MVLNMIERINKLVTSFYPDIQAVYLFGSYGTEYERPDSDVDIALLFDVHQAGIIKDLLFSECSMTLAADLKKDVDLMNLRRVNTVLQHEIVQGGRVILIQDEYAKDLFEMLVLSAYQKLNEERAEILQEIQRSGRILNI